MVLSILHIVLPKRMLISQFTDLHNSRQQQHFNSILTKKKMEQMMFVLGMGILFSITHKVDDSIDFRF